MDDVVVVLLRTGRPRPTINIVVTTNADRARRIAEDLLADTLPRRWSHTIGVAAAAGDVLEYLTKTLAGRDFSGFLDILVPWSAS